MNVATIIFAFALVSAVSAQHQLPSFTWEQDRQAHLPLLRIRYPNGVDDVAVLKEAFNLIPLGRDELEEEVDHCIYDGYLKNEKDVYVTLTGCANSDNFEIQFRSQHLKDYMFKVMDGHVKRVAPIFGKRVFNRDGSVETYDDGAIQVAEPDRQIAEPSATVRGINPRGYVLKIKVTYNDAFFARFGPDSVNAARRIMVHAQNYWRLTNSLTTQVAFLIANNVERIPGYHAAKTDLDFIREYSTAQGVDDFVYLTFRNNQPGTLGMGYVGTVCAADIRFRSNICEYVNDDMTSGHVVAHEIGHNMGMQHDFLNGKQPRYDSYGQVCSGIGSVMDYDQPIYDKWSTCSVEDFTKYINSMPQFCLRPL